MMTTLDEIKARHAAVPVTLSGDINWLDEDDTLAVARKAHADRAWLIAKVEELGISFKPVPSPSGDPFEPMVEAARTTFYGSSGCSSKIRMRRALATAIETAPLTYAMSQAWTESAISPDDHWLAMSRALAADLRSKR